jgi:transcriptional regulator with XRE-family HTH domain
MTAKRTRLKVLRAERDITQTRLAKRAGLSQARYWLIETGQGLAPRDDEKAAIAGCLGVEVDEIDWPTLEQPLYRREPNP